jgi:hypothetical protein
MTKSMCFQRKIVLSPLLNKQSYNKRLRDMKYIGFLKHQRENKQNSDKSNYN